MVPPPPGSPAAHRSARRVPRRWRVAVTVAKATLGSAVVLTMLGGQLGGSADGASADTGAATDTASQVLTARIDHLMARERCSYTGFGSDVIPATALLRTGTDRVEVVSFARGWAAYEGRRPGTLIAVCKGR